MQCVYVEAVQKSLQEISRLAKLCLNNSTGFISEVKQLISWANSGELDIGRVGRIVLKLKIYSLPIKLLVQLRLLIFDLGAKVMHESEVPVLIRQAASRKEEYETLIRLESFLNNWELSAGKVIRSLNWAGYWIWFSWYLRVFLRAIASKGYIRDKWHVFVDYLAQRREMEKSR